MNEMEDKVREKMKYENAAQQQCGSIGTIRGGYAEKTVGLDTDCASPGLLDRVSRQKEELFRQSRKIENLMELEGLLQRNPEVARILDLLDSNILR